jgi:hypothetical protein
MLSWKFRARIGAALLLSGLVFSLSGCSPQGESDTTPPDPIIKLEKSQGKYRFGVTDTINVDFSEPIDTARLAVAIAPSQGTDYKFQGRTRLRIFGTNKTAGAAHFTVKVPFSLTLAGLRDDAGNGTGDLSEAFQPFAWVDQDLVDTSFNGYDSLFASSSTWIDGTPMSDSLVTEGKLDFNNVFGKDDRQDIKIMRLVPPDSLALTLTCSKNMNLKLQVSGPYPETGLDSALADYDPAKANHTDSTRNRGSLTHKFDASFDNHFKVFGAPGTPGIYVIRLSIPPDMEGFYRLGLRLIKRKI